jgi:tetratricopeptide (TPR) repeat protein
MKADYSSIVENNYQAIKLFESLDNKEGISFSLNSIGIAYYYLGDFSKAIANFEKASVSYYFSPQ